MNPLKPIFIIASPRSGTTMLGAMLGSHSQSIALPESPFIGQIYYENFIENKPINTKIITDKLKNNFRLSHWGLNEQPSDFINTESLTKEDYRLLVESMVKKYAKNNKKENITTWVEHSPWNTRMVCSLLEIFPNAKFIHLVRDGRAICNSILPLDWGANNSIDAAHNWVEDLSYGFNTELSIGKDQCLRIYYEDIVNYPEKELQKICDFTSINYESNMIGGRGFSVPDYTKKQHLFVGELPNKQRLNAWQNNMTSKQIKHFEDIAGFMLLILNYKLIQNRKPEIVTFIERIKYRCNDLIRKEIINRINIKKRSKK